MTFLSDSLSVIFELLRCTRIGVYEEGAVRRLDFNTSTETRISGTWGRGAGHHLAARPSGGSCPPPAAHPSSCPGGRWAG